MLIVAVAWIYVVGLMALTEPTIVAGLATFLFYCVLPLGIIIYIGGSRKRTARRRAAELAAAEAAAAAAAEAKD
jgi:hypothetical protein